MRGQSDKEGEEEKGRAEDETGKGTRGHEEATRKDTWKANGKETRAKERKQNQDEDQRSGR